MLDKLMDLLQRVFDSFQADVVTNARLTVVKLTGGVDTKVYHGLNQPVTSIDIVRQDANAVIWEGAPSTAPQTFVNLHASATVTVTVRFV